MRTTVTLDNQPLDRAGAPPGLHERTLLLRETLKALIERESARRLVRPGSSEPDIAAPPRHCSA